ncbi:MAG: glycosyltransferase, partial [Bacillus sp. (in: firmicutes)]
GQIHNYYLKKFNSDSNFDVRLITYAEENELPKIDLKEYKVKHDLIIKSNKLLDRLMRLPDRIKRTVNIKNQYGGIISSFFNRNMIATLKQLSKGEYQPDIVILVWTPTVLLFKDVKFIYPNAKYVAFEHDVYFQNLKRQLKTENNYLRKISKRGRFTSEYHSEINALKNADLVITLNYKDKDLLINNGITDQSIEIVSPYFHFMGDNNTHKKSDENTIIFYGAMSRPENYECCIWFIENVLNSLFEIDASLHFVIVGAHPNENLKRYQSERVTITGFVDYPEEYLNNSLCMVAPLLVGAGIKIKILEAMSAGTVVLTNKIGIEGIPATDKVHYLHCESSEEYIRSIVELKDKKLNGQQIGENAKKLITEKFNLANSYYNYSELIKKIKR